jgi:hypothetical protein
MSVPIALLSFTGLVSGQADLKPPRRPSDVVVSAWRDAGFEVGWIRNPSEAAAYFFPDEKGDEALRPGDIVGFQVDAKKGHLRNLPDPKTKFGLDLNFCKLPPKFFFSNLRQLGQCEFLSLVACKFEDETLKPIPNMKSLRRLNLGSSTVKAEGLRTVAKSATIKALTLGDCRGVLNGSIKPIGTMQGLERLELGHCKGLGDAAMETVARLKKLKALKLNHVSSLTDKGVKALADLEKLEELELSGTQITDASAAWFASLPNLRTLGLSDCHDVTDATLKELEGSETLQEVRIGGLPITAKGAASLAKIQSLREIYAKKSGVDDAALKEIAVATNLTRLVLDECPVTDAGLKRLTGLKRLKSLSLNRCEGVTEAGVRPFLDLPELEYLFVHGTGVSKEFADSASKSLKERRRNSTSSETQDGD